MQPWCQLHDDAQQPPASPWFAHRSIGSCGCQPDRKRESRKAGKRRRRRERDRDRDRRSGYKEPIRFIFLFPYHFLLLFTTPKFMYLKKANREWRFNRALSHVVSRHIQNAIQIDAEGDLLKCGGGKGKIVRGKDEQQRRVNPDKMVQIVFWKRHATTTNKASCCKILTLNFWEPRGPGGMSRSSNSPRKWLSFTNARSPS